MRKRKALKHDCVNHTLENIFDYPLTVVESPIDYGKIIAVPEFLSNKRGTMIWLTFFSTVDTASFFWKALSTEIGKLDTETGIRLQSLGFPVDAPQSASILSIQNGEECCK